jgi:putative pyruvate formate lyase activating enzyme
MSLVETSPLAVGLERRRVLAVERLEAAGEALAECRLCAHGCGVNRLTGELGLCKAGDRAHVHLAQVEVADELELIPTFAIALSGCDLRCAFCITGAQSWNSRAGEALPLTVLAAQAKAALAKGARTVTILGGEPTIHLPSLLELVAQLPEHARLVLKTNGYGSAVSRELLDRLFDVWCVDYKFGNDVCADRLARVPNYSAVVRENLLWASQQGDLIVRHLLIPGHIECCWIPVAEWLATRLPDVKVSLRQGFWPGWQSHRHPELRRTTSAHEWEWALELAAEWNLNLIE